MARLTPVSKTVSTSSIPVTNHDTAAARPWPLPEERFDVLLHWCEWFLLWEPRKAGFAAAHNRFSEVVREMRAQA